MSAPYVKHSATLCTSRSDAANTFVDSTPCVQNVAVISFINSKPLNELSSTLPTNGLIYVAPDLNANIDCANENIRVSFTLAHSSDNALHAARPSTVQGTLIVA